MTDIPQLRWYENFVTASAHETGHAIMAWSSPYCSPPQEVSFADSGSSCSAVLAVEPADIATAREIAAFSLAGLAGETLVFGGFARPTGNDLPEAVKLARAARRAFGPLGQRRKKRSFFMRKIALYAPAEVLPFLEEAYDLALARITRHRVAYERLRDLLTTRYVDGHPETDAKTLASCLGPRPF